MAQPIISSSLVSVIILILVAAPPAFADKCKYEEDKIDDFTGEEILVTKWNLFHADIDASGFVEAAGITEGDRRFLALQTRSEEIFPYDPGQDELRHHFVVPKGARLLILLADDTIVELAAEKEAVGVARSSSANSQLTERSQLKIRYKIKTVAVIRYSLDATSFASLTSRPATHVRLTANSGDHDYKIHTKLTDEIQKALLCLQQDTV